PAPAGRFRTPLSSLKASHHCRLRLIQRRRSAPAPPLRFLRRPPTGHPGPEADEGTVAMRSSGLNPIVFALRHPITMMAGVAALAVGCVLALGRMPIDIFPPLDLPVIYIAQPYGGLNPADMESQITAYLEGHAIYINGLHHVESKTIQGMAVVKLYFPPGTNIAQAIP